jgi:hypothetical protein
MSACEFCGNDDATVCACTDCLGYGVADLALGLAIVLGGNSEDWTDIAAAQRDAIEGA